MKITFTIPWFILLIYWILALFPVFVTMYALIQFCIEKPGKNERVGIAAVSTLLFIPVFIFCEEVQDNIGFLFLYTFTGGAYGALKNRFYFSAFQTNLPQMPRRIFLNLFFKLIASCIAGAIVWKLLAICFDYLFGMTFN